jgi:hypothetical protein
MTDYYSLISHAVQALDRHDENKSQNRSFVVLTPRTIMTIMTKAMIRSTH